MAEELLVTMVSVLAAAVLAIATLVGAYLLRRIHDISDRMLALEIDVARLRLVEEDAFLQGRRRHQRRSGGR